MHAKSVPVRKTRSSYCRLAVFSPVWCLCTLHSICLLSLSSDNRICLSVWNINEAVSPVVVKVRMPSGKFYFLGNEKWTARNKLLTRIIRLFYSCYLQATQQEYRIHSRCRSDLCFVWIARINNRLFFIILVSLDKFNKIKFTKCPGLDKGLNQDRKHICQPFKPLH